MKRFFFYAILSSAFIVSCACAKHAISTGWDDNPYKAISLDTKGLEYIEKGSAFSYDFISRIEKAAEKDFVVSPLSMQFLLGMILEGAEGATAEEISAVLGYGVGEGEAVNAFCHAMLEQLPALDKATKLAIAGAIFVNELIPLEESYKQTVQQYYGAGIRNLDFFDLKGSADIINKWCSDNTEGLVKKVVDEVSPEMLAYLLNALYFKSGWSEPFKKAMTEEELFAGAAGLEKLPMMKRFSNISYAETDVFQAVNLPYGNGAFSMTVLLPKEGFSPSDVTRSLKEGEQLSFSQPKVDLWLPRFETSFNVKLNDILSAMGMPASFDPDNAQFKKMSRYAFYLSYVRQDAVIKVNEEGTEAAAVSSAGMVGATAMPPAEEPVVFHADHPFLYLITESSTGAILFAGRFAADR